MKLIILDPGSYLPGHFRSRSDFQIISDRGYTVFISSYGSFSDPAIPLSLVQVFRFFKMYQIELIIGKRLNVLNQKGVFFTGFLFHEAWSLIEVSDPDPTSHLIPEKKRLKGRKAGNCPVFSVEGGGSVGQQRSPQCDFPSLVLSTRTRISHIREDSKDAALKTRL